MEVPEGATMHDLRHFYASLLIHHGESIKVVQRNLRHAKPSITLDVYSTCTHTCGTRRRTPPETL
ncbi:tyrosine-type recombinase/integrase [Streptomyces narbonensis]|uniref:Tyrosine-type recombinase/integrase n=1 Tax=Streptomyces narbonensis TaxID=67333 RepID=A0ABV3CDC2_9ACTN